MTTAAKPHSVASSLSESWQRIADKVGNAPRGLYIVLGVILALSAVIGIGIYLQLRSRASTSRTGSSAAPAQAGPKGSRQGGEAIKETNREVEMSRRQQFAAGTKRITDRQVAVQRVGTTAPPVSLIQPALRRLLRFPDFYARLAAARGDLCLCVKYQLPGEDLDALVSVTNDEDLEHLVIEYDRLHLFRAPRRAGIWGLVAGLPLPGLPLPRRPASPPKPQQELQRDWYLDLKSASSPPLPPPPPLQNQQMQQPQVVKQEAVPVQSPPPAAPMAVPQSVLVASKTGPNYLFSFDYGFMPPPAAPVPAPLSRNGSDDFLTRAYPPATATPTAAAEYYVTKFPEKPPVPPPSSAPPAAAFLPVPGRYGSVAPGSGADPGPFFFIPAPPHGYYTSANPGGTSYYAVPHNNGNANGNGTAPAPALSSTQGSGLPAGGVRQQRPRRLLHRPAPTVPVGRQWRRHVDVRSGARDGALEAGGGEDDRLVSDRQPAQAAFPKFSMG
ncbi:uncharacterized protein [Triticum aestivum]|uniref:uncharacterized protein n=1 Tax=Triticum aestivum TaxID=4565 RepID=UPI001D028BAB|nr:uncharacterized protein LOC123089890 [Triticum aestivum]